MHDLALAEFAISCHCCITRKKAY